MFQELLKRVARALEDLVIHKVIAGRARDIEDIKAMLVKNPEYDSEYIEYQERGSLPIKDPL